MEILNNKLAEIPNLRVLSQRPETKADGYLAVDKLLNGDFANDKLFLNLWNKLWESRMKDENKPPSADFLCSQTQKLKLEK